MTCMAPMWVTQSGAGGVSGGVEGTEASAGRIGYRVPPGSSRVGQGDARSRRPEVQGEYAGCAFGKRVHLRSATA